jgi:hypothetical protein
MLVQHVGREIENLEPSPTCPSPRQFISSISQSPGREKLSVEKMNPKELAACAVVLALSDRKKPKRRGRVWAKQWLQRRVDVSLTHLLEELQSEPEDYRNFLRMNETTFDELLNLVTPLIERKTTRMRTPVSAKYRFIAYSSISDNWKPIRGSQVHCTCFAPTDG